MSQPSSPSSASPPGGDDPPVARLYREHAPSVFAYLRLRTASREEAEDLLLEVFLAAVERGDALEDRSVEAQRAWLRGVAAHKVADHYRRGRARRQVALERVAEALYADEALAPEQMALHREERERLRALLLRLPEQTRRVIHLRFVYGLSCAEIAQALGKNEGAVRKLLWRALNLVRGLYLDE